MLCSGLWGKGPGEGEFGQLDLKSWSSNKQYVGICTNKQQKNMFSWVMMYVDESHFWCEWGELERVWARRQQIPWVHILRVEEDAVERAPGPTGLWEETLTMQIQKLRARGRWDDTHQTVNPPVRGRRQTGAHIAFPNLSAVVLPRGRCTTHYLWLHYVIWIALT